MYHRFKVIVTADDIQHHKPHPDVYLEAAKRLDVRPGKCIVIEDSAPGVKAGKAAHMKVIGYSRYATDKTALSAADMVIGSFDELSYETLCRLVSGM